MNIDHLFRSLASALKSRAVGVILSGNGTDGVLALKDIKAEGGITFAQEERSAQHTGMPRSAVADGCVDYVLPPAEIAHELVRLTRHPYAAPEPAARPAADPDLIGQIISLLRATTDVDFTNYKRTTIARRIHRRMALRGVEGLADYLAVLRQEPAELHNLYQDFLIRVTQFFRDAEAFEALKEKVFPLLMQGRPAGHPIRVWVSGCSTGEEVYSLAILLGEEGLYEKTRIYATDINETVLDRARAGLFPLDKMQDYTQNYIAAGGSRSFSEYYLANHEGALFSRSLLENVVFAQHNLVSDRSFNEFHVVLCRNVMIYFDKPLQDRVHRLFYDSLATFGVLALGHKETLRLSPFEERYEELDSEERLYRKIR
jgi:two-component system, chemotaxis family, CheB/CheR fusion protein